MNSKVWQLKIVKFRCSGVENKVLDESRLIITHRGKEVMVVLSSDEFEDLKMPNRVILNSSANPH